MKKKLKKYLEHFIYHLYIDTNYQISDLAGTIKNDKNLKKELKIFLKTHPYKSWL